MKKRIEKQGIENILAGGSLIALDCDRTILTCNPDPAVEQFQFMSKMGPVLLEAASRATIAIITANGMLQLSNRLINPLLELLHEYDKMHLLPQFHFFCSGAGLYFTFNIDSTQNKSLADWKSQLLDKEWGINECYIIEHYAQLTTFNGELPAIIEIANKFCEKLIKTNKETDEKQIVPEIQLRQIKIFNHIFTPQVTIKPLSSSSKHDVRSNALTFLVKKFKQNNLGNLTVKTGGTTSIDITQSKVDKSYALNYLIDKLNLRMENVFYVGDEFTVNGNDFTVSNDSDICCFNVSSNNSGSSQFPQIYSIEGLLECEGTLFILNKYISFFDCILSHCLSNNEIPVSCAVYQFKIDFFKAKAERLLNTIFAKEPKLSAINGLIGVLYILSKTSSRTKFQQFSKSIVNLGV
jgi:hypothetical protein